MLNGLDKSKNIAENKVDSNEGERILLSSNKGDIRSPSLDLTDNYQATEDQLVKRLAEILVEGFLWLHTHDTESKQQESSDLL